MSSSCKYFVILYSCLVIYYLASIVFSNLYILNSTNVKQGNSISQNIVHQRVLQKFKRILNYLSFWQNCY